MNKDTESKLLLFLQGCQASNIPGRAWAGKEALQIVEEGRDAKPISAEEIITKIDEAIEAHGPGVDACEEITEIIDRWLATP